LHLVKIHSKLIRAVQCLHLLPVITTTAGLAAAAHHAAGAAAVVAVAARTVAALTMIATPEATNNAAPNHIHCHTLS